MIATIGGREGDLEVPEVRGFMQSRLAEVDLEGRSLCPAILDATRTCPLPVLLSPVAAAVETRVRSCTAVVALGTHAPMTGQAINAMVG